jgi:hypothetical protein
MMTRMPLRWLSTSLVLLSTLGCKLADVDLGETGADDTAGDTDSTGDGDGDGDPVGDGDGDGDGDGAGDGDGDGDADADAFIKAETAAALDDLQEIVDRTFALFLAETPPNEGDPEDWPLHRCPTAFGQNAWSSAYTPDFALNCILSPTRQCIPVAVVDGPGQYSHDVWLDNPIWSQLGFAKDVPHAFHFEFQSVSATTGYGACTFSVSAMMFLDEEFTTAVRYERRGSADENGIVEDPMVYVFDSL